MRRKSLWFDPPTDAEKAYRKAQARLLGNGQKIRQAVIGMSLARSLAVFVVSYVGMAAGFAVLYWGRGWLDRAGSTESRDLVECLYFSITCQTTVGFGDLSPLDVSSLGQMAAALQAVTGTMGFAALMGVVVVKLLLPPEPLRVSRSVVFYPESSSFRVRVRVLTPQHVPKVDVAFSARFERDTPATGTSASVYPVIGSGELHASFRPGRSYVLSTVPVTSVVQQCHGPVPLFSRNMHAIDFPEWKAAAWMDLADRVVESNPDLARQLASHGSVHGQYVVLTPDNVTAFSELSVRIEYLLAGVGGSGAALAVYDIVGDSARSALTCGRFRGLVKRGPGRPRRIKLIALEGFDDVIETQPRDCEQCQHNASCGILAQRAEDRAPYRAVLDRVRQ